MLRSVIPVILLLASVGGQAAAMDQSAIEETNCLMACDANQENCGAGQARQNEPFDCRTSFAPGNESVSGPRCPPGDRALNDL